MRFLTALRRDERGLATIELALWGSMFFLTMLGAIDFSLWRSYQLRLGAAVEQGSLLMFNNGAAINADYAAKIAAYVRQVANLPGRGATVNVTCNGNSACSATPGYVCASTTIPVTYTPSTQGATCGSTNTTAGVYATATATYSYRPVVLPTGRLMGKTLTERVTVRVK